MSNFPRVVPNWWTIYKNIFKKSMNDQQCPYRGVCCADQCVHPRRNAKPIATDTWNFFLCMKLHLSSATTFKSSLKTVSIDAWPNLYTSINLFHKINILIFFDVQNQLQTKLSSCTVHNYTIHSHNKKLNTKPVFLAFSILASSPLRV